MGTRGDRRELCKVVTEWLHTLTGPVQDVFLIVLGPPSSFVQQIFSPSLLQVFRSPSTRLGRSLCLNVKLPMASHR